MKYTQYVLALAAAWCSVGDVRCDAKPASKAAAPRTSEPRLRPRKDNIVTWRLPDKTRVRFYQLIDLNDGRDTTKVLEVTPPRGRTRSYPFAVWHAGYNEPELRISADSKVIWVVAREVPSLGPSLVLRTREFRDEGEEHPAQVGLAKGRVVKPVRG